MSGVTHWIVPVDHPAFAGHFPGTPILPGVVLLDMALHAVTVSAGVVLDTGEISAVKFLSPAGPGDMLEIRHSNAAGGVIRFDIVTGARKVASGSVVPHPA
jgi:3-hydroxymyristoyl/3-hydroxydecanoyl-(acyl carrier protein) dehydratase